MNQETRSDESSVCKTASSLASYNRMPNSTIIPKYHILLFVPMSVYILRLESRPHQSNKVRRKVADTE
jgi:hypothetical protein